MFRHTGHPEQLKFVSSYIREVFNGSVAAFLEYNKKEWIIRDIATLLEKQLQSLSNLERHIIAIIAESTRPLSLERVASSLNSLDSLNPTDVWSAVQSLRRRALISVSDDQSGFVLEHPIIANYIIELQK